MNLEVSDALASEREALSDYERMSDVKRLRYAKAAAASLHPPHPDLVDELDRRSREILALPRSRGPARLADRRRG